MEVFPIEIHHIGKDAGEVLGLPLACYVYV
jgi:hypothetical protein